MPTIGEIWRTIQSNSVFMIADVTPTIITGVATNGNRIRVPADNLERISRFERAPDSVSVPCSVPKCSLPGWISISRYVFCPLHLPQGVPQGGWTSTLRTQADPYWVPLACPTCGNPYAVSYWGDPFRHTQCLICSTEWNSCPPARLRDAVRGLNGSARVVFVPMSLWPFETDIGITVRLSTMPPDDQVVVCSRDDTVTIAAALVEGSIWVDLRGQHIEVVRVDGDRIHFRLKNRSDVKGNMLITRDDFLLYHRPITRVMNRAYTIFPEVGQEWGVPDELSVRVVEVYPTLATVVVDNALGQRLSLPLEDFQGGKWSLIIRKNVWAHLLTDD